MSYFHPQRMPVLPARRRRAARQQLEQVVARSARSRARRHPAVIVAATAIVVLSSTGAAGVVAYEAVANRIQARCFTVDDVTSHDFTLIAQASKPLTDAVVRNARGTCEALFRIGVLRKGHPPGRLARRPGHHRVPRLVVCVWPDQTAAVFPGGQGTCAKLGLPAAARRQLGPRRLRPGTAAPIP
ncbi:MAG TPA: hypothetical protein VMU94_28945 [Streptosporangiaceae bacterium]|nr:hypothetical protein [Streptosporangiaceae bacterium]